MQHRFYPIFKSL